MPKKLLPYVFLGVLMIVLFFVIGFRSGQQVEKTNKTITALISVAPSATPAPSQPPLTFKTYTNSDCLISFVYPGYFEIAKEGTGTAHLRYKKQSISFDCTKTASPEAGDGLVSVIKTNPKTGKKVVLTVEKSVQSLVESTFKFITK